MHGEPVAGRPARRTAFQRDRDRIIHSEGLRRLTHKTQVFAIWENDHIRTRFSHSLETSQVARNIGRFLLLNEDLIEAIALAHDIGHAPFGHAGEWALQAILKECRDASPACTQRGTCGFTHAVQSVRVLSLLETKPGLRLGQGLNLTKHVLYGVLHHSDPSASEPSRGRGTRGNPAPPRPQETATTMVPVALTETPDSLEAHVVRLADKIAYTCTDLEDAERARVLDTGTTRRWAKRLGADPSRGYSGLIARLVQDIVGTSARNLDAVAGAGSWDRAKVLAARPIRIGDGLTGPFQGLRRALERGVYTCGRAKANNDFGMACIHGLFRARRPGAGSKRRGWPPTPYRGRRARHDHQGAPVCSVWRIVDDIAGMTDHAVRNWAQNLNEGEADREQTAVSRNEDRAPRP